MMNKQLQIFCDLHNSGLYYSLHLLLEKRLGHILMAPIGMEWAPEYWKIHAAYNYNIETAKQYLQIKPDYIPKDGTQVLNHVVDHNPAWYEVEDLAHNYIRKHITLEQFKNINIDIVIATIPEHIEPYKKLAQMKGAKFILQVGNIWWDKSVDFSQIPNLMAAVQEFNVPASCNSVFIHEEFDSFFKPSGLPPKRKIVSFINCLRETGHFQKYYELKSELPEYEFFSYGGSCDNGVINTQWEIVQIMQECQFGHHTKFYGDGFGLIFHQWFACGKPIITCFSDYADKLGGKLLIDMETAINADNRTTQEIAEIIRNLEPEKYAWMCQRAYEVFKENVDFEKDSVKVKEFLERLK